MYHLPVIATIGEDLSARLEALPMGETLRQAITRGDAARFGVAFNLRDGLIECTPARARKPTQQVKVGKFAGALLRDRPDLVERVAHLLSQPTVTIDLVTGDAIAEAYHEIPAGHGSGYYSCMAGKPLEWFDLYARNPQISLAVVSLHGDPIGRCLVYTDSDGIRYHSRRLYMPASLIPAFETWAESQGILDGRDETIPAIDLDEATCDYYPYLDDFAGVSLCPPRLSDSYDIECQRTDGHGTPANQTICECCDEATDEDDVHYVNDTTLCSYCLNRNYTFIDDRLFNDDDLRPLRDLVYDDTFAALLDDSEKEINRHESDFSDLVLIVLENGVIGTPDELHDEGYLRIEHNGETYWTTEAIPIDEFAIGCTQYGRIADAVDY